MSQRRIIASLSIVGLALILTSCTSEIRLENPNFQTAESTTPHSSESEVEVSEAPKSSAESSLLYASIGEKIERDGYEIILNSAKFASAGEFFEPDNGQFLILNLAITNRSSEDMNVSSLGNFQLQGSDLYLYSIAFGADTKGSLDTSLLSGKAIRGEIAYDVPELASYELMFRPTMFSDYDIVFVIEESQISRD